MFRLCGTVLDQEVATARRDLVLSIWALVLEKQLPVTTVHYNALLRVHLENRHKFDPLAVLEDMKQAGAEPDRETYQCLISSYCQEGNIDGASKILQSMKQKGFKVNENIFNSLIIGHSENGDMARASGILKVMKQWGLNPSTETYLTLACAYAKHGDIAAMDKIVAECAGQGIEFKDGDYLELLFVLCEHNHKDQVGQILSQLHPEAEEFGCLASHLVVRLVNAGHDDVAYNLVQFTQENSVEESGKQISAEFLDQLVRVNTTVAKLLWLLKDMSTRKIHNGGLENLIDVAMKNKNLSLTVKLADILVSEGGKITKKQFKHLLNLSRKSGKQEDYEHVFSCVKIGSVSNHMTPEVLKKFIFPMLNTWPELSIAQLEDYGLSRDQTVTPMIEYLVGRGETESAGTVAGIFSEHVDQKLKFLTSAAVGVNSVCNHFAGAEPEPPKALKAVKSSDETMICMVDQLLADDKMEELELMLDTREAPKDRELVYVALLKVYVKHRLIDRAIHLSRRLRAEEQLNIPIFYETLGELIESQYHGPEGEQRQQQQFAPQQPMPAPHQLHMNPYYNLVPVPTPVGLHYLPTDSYQYVYPMPQGFYPPPGGYYAPPQPELSVSPYPTPEHSQPGSEVQSVSGDSYYSDNQGYLHRQLKKAVAAGDAEKGMSVYLTLETSGKVVNVTETSSLIEQLVRADRTSEATEITRTMLFRNTHPLPKIFRFLLNKLAITGAVEDITSIGEFLSTKIKKDVSYDNRLCNAYLSAGRGAEFLDLLVRDLDTAVQSGDKDRLVIIQDRFPRGGAMGLLDNHPELLDRFTTLAVEFAKTGYVAPMNVLWTYHFINGNNEVADRIWEDHVR